MMKSIFGLTYRFKATDPRDNIFALAGIASIITRDELEAAQ